MVLHLFQDNEIQLKEKNVRSSLESRQKKSDHGSHAYQKFGSE